VDCWKILITAPYLQAQLDRFSDFFSSSGVELVVPPVKERLEESQLIQYVGDVDGIICGDDQLSDYVLRQASKLKVISKWGTGIDSIDQVACKHLSIVVRNTPNAFSEPVADSVMGYILSFARRLYSMHEAMKLGVWMKIPGVALNECVLGVVGVGNTGKAVVRRAIAFGMKVLGNDLVEMPSEFLVSTGIQMVSKEELFQQADFLSLNCDLNPTSYHLMSDAQFGAMKPTAVIINTSRGPVIDEPALIRALQEERLGGAALDVFEHEPLPTDSPLRTMKNVLLAPHNANSSPRAWDHVHWNTINNLLEELQKAKR